MAYKEVKEYYVYAQGQSFVLYEEQLRFDAPNVLTEHFNQPHPYDASKSAPPLKLTQDPALFTLIVRYLSGYNFLPLPAAGLPSGISVQAALEGLLRDAERLRLHGLVRLLKKHRLPQSVQLKSCNWAGVGDTIVELADLVDEEFEPTEGDLYWHSRTELLSGDQGLPVLVLARDVPVRLMFEVDIHPDRRARMEETSKLILSFHPPTLVSSFASESSNAHQDGTSPTKFILSGRSTPDAFLTLDGAAYRGAELESAWANYRGPSNNDRYGGGGGGSSLFETMHPCQDFSVGDSRDHSGPGAHTKRILFEVWAERVLFTVKRLPKGGSAPLGERKYEMQILDAKLQSRANVLSQLELGL